MESKPNLFSLLSGLLVALGLLLYMTTFTVRQNEFAVVYTFGRPSAPKQEPGLYVKAPWPIQKVIRISGAIHIFEGTFEETYTGDGKNIILMAYVCWRVEDPLVFVRETGADLTKAEGYLRDFVRNYKNGVFGRHPLNHLISTNLDDIKFDQIENEILQPVQEEAKKFGIEVAQIGIKKLALPEKTVEVVFERMIKERRKIADAHEADGERQAEEIRSKAKKDADEKIARANANAKVIRGQADTRAASSYQILSQDTELALFLRQMEALKKIMKDEKSTVILTTDMTPFTFFDYGFTPQNEKKPSTGNVKPE